MTSIEKLRADLEKTKAKIAALQKRQKEQEAKLTEAENLEIAQMVKAVELTPEQLAPILRAYASGSINLPDNLMEADVTEPCNEELSDEY